MAKLRFVSVKEKRSTVSCNECRRRKKGCDEKRPKCSACLKRGVDCIYSFDKKVYERIKQNPHELGLAKRMPFDVGAVIPSDLKTILTGASSPRNISWFPDIDLDFSSVDSISCDLAAEIGGTIPDIPASFKSFKFNDSPLMLDLDYIALSIVEDFSKSNRVKDGGGVNETFVKCYDLLSPLVYKSRPILIALSSWILSLSDDLRMTQFFQESLALCNELESQVALFQMWDEDTLIDYIVCLTFHTIIASTAGDAALWKVCFERSYSILKKIGLEEISGLLRKEENRKVFVWVVNCFFYSDIFKMIRVTSERKLSPMFSKKEYTRFITNSDNDQSKVVSSSLSIDSYFDSSVSCCANLFIVLGETNALYDQFTEKVHKTLQYYYKHIGPVLDDIEDEEDKFKFVNTQIYLDYEQTRLDHHEWVRGKTFVLEQRITNCRICYPGNIVGPVDSKLNDYFELMKYSVLLYMNFKIRELPAVSYVIKRLLLHMFNKFRRLIDDPRFSTQMLFPLLIAGANICERRDRVTMKTFYLRLSRNSGSRSKNLRQVWEMIQEFWRLNPNGVSYEMWQIIINKYDWNICLV